MTIFLVDKRQEVNIEYVLKNRVILLLADEKELRNNSGLKKDLEKLFKLKASGSEEG